jgi:hypothetical protein
MHLRERRGPEPARDTANLHHIGHNQVRCASRDGVLHVQRSPPVLSALNGGAGLARDQRMPGVVVSERWFFNPRKAFSIEDSQSLDRLCRSEALVVVHHDVHVGTNGLPHGTDHGDVLLHRRVADLGFDAGESSCRPAFSGLRAPRHAVVPDRPVAAERLRRPAQQPHERHVVNAGQRIPQGHVDCRQRDTNKPLRSEQSESLGKLLLYLGRSQQVTLHQRLDVPDQLSGRLEGRWRVGEHHAVAAHSGVGDRVGQDEGRLRNHATRSPMRFCHRHADCPDSELSNRRRRSVRHLLLLRSA